MQPRHSSNLASPNQALPGIEANMEPRPVFDDPSYRPSGRLEDKVAIITGGDSGIGRAVAVAFAKEGADVVIAYLDEHSDAEETKSLIEARGRRCELIAGDIGYEGPHPRAVIDLALRSFGHLDVLVNNAGIRMHKATLIRPGFGGGSVGWVSGRRLVCLGADCRAVGAGGRGGQGWRSARATGWSQWGQSPPGPRRRQNSWQSSQRRTPR